MGKGKRFVREWFYLFTANVSSLGFGLEATQPRVNHDPASAALQPASRRAKSLGFAAVICQCAGQVTHSLGGGSKVLVINVNDVCEGKIR